MSNITRVKRDSGFTIVELAIVIVVIAILAAITIVSYGGIQNRAYETAVLNDLKVMGDGAELVTTKGMGSYPTADQAGLESIVKVSRPEAYLDGTSGSLAYCRSNDSFSFVARVAGSKKTYAFTSGQGIRVVVHSGARNTLCANAGVPSSSSGYASVWLFNGASSPKWQPWIALPTS